jgi:aryl-alcohol dehydrogenase-like predicted oxidoreductase
MMTRTRSSASTVTAESRTLTRRDFLAGSSAAGLLACASLAALPTSPAPLLMRTVPRSGARLPIVGLGGSASFRSAADAGDVPRLATVLETLVAGGGSVFDTAAIYGNSESVAGAVAQTLGIADEIFWATKVYVEPGSVSARDQAAAARRQLEQSFERTRRRHLDLIQLHDVTDVRGQRGILDEMQSLKHQGRVRHLGATSIRKEHYADLEHVMRDGAIDFVGVDYAIDNRSAADRVLPLAKDLGIAVLVYRPFGNSRLWSRVAGHRLPSWAAELGIGSWAQFFIKYVAAHPATTVVTPGTSKPNNMLDNLRGGIGPMPDVGMRLRMERYIDSLPSST